MSHTIYDRNDLINKVIVDNTLVNCSNVGGPDPTVSMTGSLSDSSYSMSGAVASNSEFSSFSYQLLYDIDHSSPVNPITPGAQIRRVTITMQTAAPSATASANPIDMPNEGPLGFRGGSATATAQLVATVIPSPMDTSIGTVTKINATNSNTSGNTTGTLNESASVSPTAIEIGFDIDFTTNPGGLYPLGYMTYADFLTNFFNMLFSYTGSGTGATQWAQFSPPDHPTAATGTVAATVSLQVTNFSMDVEWDVPTQWSISPATLNIPDNVITISRPDPGVPPQDDTEQIEALYLNDKKIEPNDPWVISWLRLTILIHLIIPDIGDSSTLTIQAVFAGTQFTGRVGLGSLTINYADLSGIYEFDIDTHHDQLYARTTTSTTVTTQNVAIPAPFFVTAFLDNDDTDILHYTGTRMRVTGEGSLKQIFQSLDYINTEALANTTLRTSNNVNPFTLGNFIDQECSLRVYQDTLDDYMNVSQLIIFTAPLWSGYPQ